MQFEGKFFYARKNDVILLPIMENQIYLQFDLSTLEEKAKDSLLDVVGGIGIVELDLETRRNRLKNKKNKKNKNKNKNKNNNCNSKPDISDDNAYFPGVFNSLMLRCKESDLEKILQQCKITVCVNTHVVERRGGPIQGLLRI